MGDGTSRQAPRPRASQVRRAGISNCGTRHDRASGKAATKVFPDSGIERGLVPIEELRPGQVHLWWSILNLTEPLGSATVYDMLSPDEVERAARFYFMRDRQRFILARGMLRSLLGLYTGMPPQEIRFQYLASGKPRLKSCNDLEFNLAHSEELVVLAIARSRAVGVDVERFRPVPDMDQVATMTFSRAEQGALSALGGDQRLVGFFNCWTRKEAYAKALGDGLGLPLDAFDVSVKTDEPAALLANRLKPSDVVRWSVRPVTLHDDYVGALVVEGHDTRVSLRHWDFERARVPDRLAA